MSISGLFAYEFILNAIMAGTLAGILTGLVGYFLVLRQLTFVGHALGHIGFAGATGAYLLGLSPWTGQLVLTILSAIGMGCLGNRLNGRDIAVGIVLAFSLGLGMLFLHFYNAYASQAITVLFGNLLGVSTEMLQSLAVYALLSCIAIASIAKPLLFISLEPDLAEARGLPLYTISLFFLIVAAIAIVIASQIVGILFVFTLLVGPAASALNWAHTTQTGILLSIGLAVLTVWLGLLGAFITDWPIPFWMSALSLGTYLLSVGTSRY